MEKNYPAVTISFGNQQLWIKKKTLKDYVLIENDVYQMMIEKKVKANQNE